VDELQSLRRGIRDLVALTTLPAIWAGRPPYEIAESLSDVLVSTLRLDLVYINLKRSQDESTYELVRADQHLIVGEQAQEIGEIFAPLFRADIAHETLSIADPFARGRLQIAVIPLGYDGKNGFAVAGLQSSKAFTDLDHLLLNVAANQAVIALEQAQLLADLRAANQLKDTLLAKEHAARIEAQEANATKLKFLAMISHELRTPLTSIKGFATTLLAEDVRFEAKEQREFIQIIDEEADKLTELVEQLLDLSRLQSGTMRITAEMISLHTILDLARPHIQLLASDHSLQLNVPNILPSVWADAQRIVQVFSNLVHNAAKYSPRYSSITIAVTQYEHAIRVEVTDEGIGIPEEERPLLFEAFRQVDRPTDSKTGAGLGLAICKGIIAAHRGTIWIQEQEQPGTTIAFTLPIATQSA